MARREIRSGFLSGRGKQSSRPSANRSLRVEAKGLKLALHVQRLHDTWA